MLQNQQRRDRRLDSRPTRETGKTSARKRRPRSQSYIWRSNSLLLNQFYEDDIEPILKSILKVASDYWSQIICSPGISVERTTPAGQHADVQQGSTSLSAQAEVSKCNADV